MVHVKMTLDRISMADSSPPGRTFRGQSQEERVAQRRRQLLDAGLALFGSRGFHAVSVRDVCGEAKLTERYFYESFQNREALFVAVYREGVECIRNAIVLAIGQAAGSAEEASRAALYAYFNTLRKEPPLSRVLLIDSLTIGGEAGNQTVDSMSSFVEIVSAMILQLYPDLPKHKLDPLWIGNGLVGATVFMAQRWAQGGFSEPVELLVDNCSAFVDGLAALVRTQNQQASRKASKRTGRERRAS
jgi:AcrR family transcriptional regulator